MATEKNPDHVSVDGVDLTPYVKSVQEPEHWLRGNKWYTNRGEVPTCNCGLDWPCAQARQDIADDILAHASQFFGLPKNASFTMHEVIEGEVIE